MNKKLLALIFFITLLIGCSSDSDIASHNLSKKAEMFNLNRKIIFYNGITNDYMLSIEGRCSIEKDNVDNQLEVTCKCEKDSYKKHFLGLSDNVTYFVEQLGYAKVDVYRYKVIFKPELIVPDIDLETRNPQ